MSLPKRIARLLVVLILYIVPMSCKTKNADLGEPAFLKHLDADTIKMPAPIGTARFTTDSMNVLASRVLSMENIQSGFDDLQIRIWLQYSVSDKARVIVIRRKDFGWLGKIIYFKYHYDDSVRIVAISNKIQTGIPLSGWLNFEKKMTRLGIHSLRDSRQINGYQGCMGGDMITIEIATLTHYGEYSFPCYEVEIENWAEVKSAVNILNLIQKEFQFRIFPRPDLPSSISD